MEDGVRLGDQLALAGLTGAHEITLARQLSIGQRILVSMKRSEFDLEPQKYTGMVKYVGKIDSEFIDNRIYVGVKLDEPGRVHSSLRNYHLSLSLPPRAVGDSDGLVKGKRYFHCPAKHGKIVRLSNVEAILPRSVSGRHGDRIPTLNFLSLSLSLSVPTYRVSRTGSCRQQRKVPTPQPPLPTREPGSRSHDFQA